MQKEDRDEIAEEAFELEFGHGIREAEGAERREDKYDPDLDPSFRISQATLKRLLAEARDFRDLSPTPLRPPETASPPGRFRCPEPYRALVTAILQDPESWTVLRLRQFYQLKKEGFGRYQVEMKNKPLCRANRHARRRLAKHGFAPRFLTFYARGRTELTLRFRRYICTYGRSKSKKAPDDPSRCCSWHPSPETRIPDLDAVAGSYPSAIITFITIAGRFCGRVSILTFLSSLSHELRTHEPEDLLMAGYFSCAPGETFIREYLAESSEEETPSDRPSYKSIAPILPGLLRFVAECAADVCAYLFAKRILRGADWIEVGDDGEFGPAGPLRDDLHAAFLAVAECLRIYLTPIGEVS